MADIFGPGMGVQGGWVVGGSIISFGSMSSNLIVSSCEVQFSREIRDEIPINQDKRWLIAGLGSGALKLGTIVGPADGVTGFFAQFSNVCDPTNSIRVDAMGTKSCGTGTSTSGSNKGISFICRNCVLEAVGMNVTRQGQLAIVNGSFQVKFFGLTME
jgi:hypothetical protein